MPETRQEYYQCVGIKDDTLYMLDSLFDHGDGFRGATGTIFEPITQAYIDQQNSLENAEDYLEDIWREMVRAGSTKSSLEDFIEDALAEVEDGHFLGQDDSYVDKIPEEIRAKYFPDAVTFNCIGGGRCFDADMKFDIVIDQRLINRINAYEKDNDK